jgi:ornithine decarboxylase
VHSKRTVPGTIAATAAATTDGAAVVAKPELLYHYYLNDGVYGSFNCIIFDHYCPTPRVLTRKGSVYTAEHAAAVSSTTASLWGPTCDSMDCVVKEVALPELSVGDWLCFEGMGAYTSAAASNFNGLYSTRTVYIDTGRC